MIHAHEVSPLLRMLTSVVYVSTFFGGLYEDLARLGRWAKYVDTGAVFIPLRDLQDLH